MAGGIIQIATYGSQDLFLTGVPEITFFKIVYRRHTNFAIESKKIDFNDAVGFTLTSSSELLRVGDLVGKIYVEITLPQINLQRNTLPDPTDAQNNYNIARDNYKILKSFMSINRSAYVAADDQFIAENSQDKADNMIKAVQNIFNDPSNSITINDFNTLITTTPLAPFTYAEVSMDSIVSLFDTGSNPNDIFKAMSIGINKSIKTQKFYYDQVLATKVILDDLTNPNIRFAWVDRIGHAIMDQIEVRIGGHKIDRHYGDWLNIWYELTAVRDLQDTYYKMIGNVSSLTTFDRVIKPKYILKVPLQFWFCRFSGLALPLISLEYHNTTLHIKFRSFEELCYIESGTTIKFTGNSTGLFLDEVPDEMNIDINAQLLVDYVYLDTSERRRFAQSSHEYLIEQLQILDQNNISASKLQLVLNNFVHPSKELIWVSQKVEYTQNTDGTNQCRWDNYSLTDNNTGNPIAFSSLDFHSYNRVMRLDGNYFNYLQPYETHHTTPSDGINMYSFSLFPEEQQPSGSANLSRLSRIVLYIEFDASLFPINATPAVLNFRIYTRNINILRFLNGMGALAFVYG